MLFSSELQQVREMLEQSRAPFFLHDNDADGLCSYILLRRWLGRGEGTPVRTHPDLDAGYARTALDHGADLVVVLDCPFLGDEFIETLAEANVPILWIDHHLVESKHYTHEHVHVFNPMLLSKGKNNAPVTFWSYRLSGKKDDAWIALMGCVADHYLPSFAKSVSRTYPDLVRIGTKGPFGVYYGTELGRLARSLGFGLKDATRHVKYLHRFLIECPNPHALMEELHSTSSFAVRVNELMSQFDRLLSEARDSAKPGLVFFSYGGVTSMSADIANALSYYYPDRIIAVAYVHGGLCNLSLRGANVQRILATLLPLFEGATGGGHRNAVGARVRMEDLDRFKEELVKVLSKRL